MIAGGGRFLPQLALCIEGGTQRLSATTVDKDSLLSAIEKAQALEQLWHQNDADLHE